jgi:hypothetical protein
MPAKPVKPGKAKSTPNPKATPTARQTASSKPKAASPKAESPKAASPKAASGQKAAKETAPTPVVHRSSAELHFTETTILRGEAVEPGEAMPSGATHEIAGRDDCGQPIIKRKRFSIY